MKKLFLLSIMSMLLLVGLTSMVTTPPPTTMAQQCATEMCPQMTSGHHPMFPNLGQCVAWCHQSWGPAHSTTPGAVATCNMWRGMGMLEMMADWYGFQPTFGACVNFVKNNP